LRNRQTELKTPDNGPTVRVTKLPDTSNVIVYIPTVNALEATQVSIDSCLAQTRSTQCVVVDNASSDQSFQRLIDIYGDLDRVTLVRNSHDLGRVGNWNRCLDIAESNGHTFVRFLFSGDELLPKCIERCEEVLEEYPGVAALAHDYLFADHDRLRVSAMPLSGYLNPREVRALNLVQGGFLGSIVANVYSMSAVGKMRFNELFVGKVDFDFAVLDGQSGFYLPEVLARANIKSRRTFRKSLSLAIECEVSFNRSQWLERSVSSLSRDQYQMGRSQIYLDFVRRGARYQEVSVLLSAVWCITSSIFLRKPSAVLKKVLRKRIGNWNGSKFVILASRNRAGASTEKGQPV